jgi:hypothetical protein
MLHSKQALQQRKAIHMMGKHCLMTDSNTVDVAGCKQCYVAAGGCNVRHAIQALTRCKHAQSPGPNLMKHTAAHAMRPTRCMTGSCLDSWPTQLTCAHCSSHSEGSHTPTAGTCGLPMRM